jgi:TolA-binding protein
MSDDSSEMEMSESTESALIESMEIQIDAMHDEIQKIHETINKQNKKRKTFQSIVKSDLIGKIFKCL